MKPLLAITIAVAASLSLPVSAQNFAKPEDAIKYRKAAFTVLAGHFGTLGAMANGRVPFDAKVAAESAQVVETLAKLPWAGFTAGSDKGETRAKPEIWTQQAKFKEAGDKSAAEIARLVTAARTGNLDNLKAAFGPAAASCKACHDNFRKE